MNSPRRVFGAVFLLSAAVLILQIALNRIFSFTIWYHFAYISISLALLGFGASGSMLTAFPRLGAAAPERLIGLYGALCSAGTLLMLVVVGTVPLNPFEMLRQGSELAKFAVQFSFVSMPFFFAGLAIIIALRAVGPGVHRLYFWDLVGAGIGCALSIVLIDLLGTPRVVVLVALIFAAAGLAAAGRQWIGIRNANLAIGVLGLLAIGPLPGWLPFKPSKDKHISVPLERGTVHFTKWGSIFRTDLIGKRQGEWRHGGYRGSPGRRTGGTSPSYEGAYPLYRFIVHDGGASTLMYRVQEGMPGLEMLRHHILTSPYVVRDAPEVLIIGVGGGVDVVNALQNGASRVTGVELDPVTVDLITNRYREFSGGIYDRPDVTIHAGEGRHFVRSTELRFDLVQITGVDTLAALSSGAYVLAENYVYTVEAYLDYFGALNDGGILSIGTFDFHPEHSYPRHALRFAILADEALRRHGADEPGDHLMVVAEESSLGHVEILAKLTPFTNEEIAAMERFIDDNGFESWYLPRRSARQQALFGAMLAAPAAQREEILDQTFLQLLPPIDDRPFFFSYYKWRHLLARRDEIDPGHTLATGQLVLVLILALATAFSVVAIALPLARVRRGAANTPGRWGFLGYFAALGCGFIFAEISFVQRFILFLGYPTHSLTVTLFSFLTFAGIGAYLSGRLPGEPAKALPALVAVLTAIVVLYVVALPSVTGAFLAAPMAVRIVVTIALCAPLGGVLGMFFPYGIRLISAVNRDFIPWAWAANGCLTVVGSVLSIILAMTFGFTAVILLLPVVYGLGAASFVLSWRRQGLAAGAPPTPPL